MKAVILAGGRGKRLAPHSAILPKPLIPIGDRPIMEIIIRQLKNFGFNDIALAVGYQMRLIETYFGSGERFGVRIEYVREQKPLGTSAPLSLLGEMHEKFLVMNGDILTDVNYQEIIKTHVDSSAFATVGMYTKKVEIDLGVIEADEEGVIHDYIEKPSMTYDVSMGLYVFEPQVVQYVPKNEKMDMPELINILLKEKLRVLGFRYSGFWLDIGRYEDYQKAVEIFDQDPGVFLH